MAEPLSPNVSFDEIPPLVHGLRADSVHWTECWNFGLAGTRSSTEMVGTAEGWPSLREVPLDALRTRPDQWPATALSPFAMLVWQGAMVHAGMVLGMGVQPYETRWYSPEQTELIVRHADRELAFEAVRRDVAPHTASRLTCIWAAEDTLDGRNFVQGIMGHSSFVMPVSIVFALRVSRCDARWLDRWQRGDGDAAIGYWSGKPTDDGPLWEYLIDGTIRADDPEDADRVKRWSFENVPPDLRGPPAATDE